MAQHVETLVDTPEALEGIAIYDHPNFIHRRDLRTVQLKIKDGANIELTFVELSATENRFLIELEQLPNKVRDAKELREKAFGERYSIEIVMFYLRRLREKLEPDPKHPETFITRRGVGYIFNDASRETSESKGISEGINVRPERVHSHMGFTWNPDMFVIKYKGEEIDLTKTETIIFGLLIQNAGSIIANSRLYQEIYDLDDPSLYTGSIRKYIQRIRKKVNEATGEDSTCIETIHRVGYKIAGENRPGIPSSATIFESTA